MSFLALVLVVIQHHTSEIVDEFADTVTYVTHIRATDYKPGVMESEVVIRCYADGNVDVEAHQGGRYSQESSKRFDIKIDDGEARSINNDHAGSKMKLIRDLSDGQTMIFRVTEGISFRANLSGSAVALRGARTQCLEPYLANYEANLLREKNEYERERGRQEELGLADAPAIDLMDR